jgi:ABC-type transport system involved in multi-copper enzyme maturation permease subunit
VSNPIIGKLIWKELALNRAFIVAATSCGLLSTVIALLGKVAFAIGSIMFLTVLIAYGVILPMYAIAGERKEKARLFVLSLPVSRGQYIWTKVVGVLLAFLGPWSVMLVAALTLVLATPVPDGMVVFTTLMMGFALADFSVIVCSSMLLVSEGAMAIVIILMNMSVTLFMVGITNLTSIGAATTRDVIDWSPTALTVLGAEAAVIAVAFGVVFWVTGREPEVI